VGTETIDLTVAVVKAVVIQPTEVGTETIDLTVAVVKAVVIQPTEVGTETTDLTVAVVKVVVREDSKVKGTKKVALKITNSKEVEAVRRLALSLEEVLLISN
jgi:hypothetical protein